jgi:hypothetical protein
VRVDFQGYPSLAKLDLATGNVALVAPKAKRLTYPARTFP